MSQTYVIVPTFRETAKIRSLLNCFAAVQPGDVSLLVVNANYPDSTSDLIDSLKEVISVHEIQGHPGLYWSGLVNLGLHSAARNGHPDDYVVLMNADISFSDDIFAILRSIASQIGPAEIGALVHAHGRIISSGVQVRSWAFGLNRHPYAGMRIEDMSSGLLVDVDFLPTRCVMFPLSVVQAGELINEKLLPHYGGDYEYTHRLKHLGYRACFSSDVIVECDVSNTRGEVFYRSTNLWQRVKELFSIRSASNPIFRTRFIWTVYPSYARITATAAYLAKSVIETVFGGHEIRRLIARGEMGFS